MATLLGSLPPFVDIETGELIDGPVRVSMIEYREGVELSAVPRPGPRLGVNAKEREWRRYDRDLREHGPLEARRRAEERKDFRANRSAEESVRRAKTRLRRIVRYFGLRLMVTLTFPGEGVHDYDGALRLVQDFIHDHGRMVHFGGHYVAVPELHSEGHGWHWHVLVSRRFSRAELLSLRDGWTAYLRRRGMEPSGGARYTRVDLKDWGTASRAAAYAAKYIGKSFEDANLGKHRRRFLASQGAVVESQRATAESLAEVRAVVEQVPGGYVVESDAEDGRPPLVWACWDT